MRLIVTGTLAMMLTIFGVPSALLAQSASYSTLVAQAKSALSDGNNEQALAESQKAIKMDPSRWEAYLIAGGALQGQKQYKKAVDAYTKALDRAPEPKKAAVQNLLEQCMHEELGVAWAVGKFGVILHTVDGGSTWNKQVSGFSQPSLNSVVFATPQLGWVVGYTWGGAHYWEGKSVILHTEDSGNTWKEQKSGSGTGDFLTSVDFATPQSGWAVGYDLDTNSGTILHTEDGGTTWKTQVRGDAGGLEKLRSVTFATPQSGWAVGDSQIVHTGDGGRSWQTQSRGGSLNSVACATSQACWVVGFEGTILHTEDSGSNWTPQPSGTVANLQSVAFAVPRSGWAVGDKGTIVHTEDGGATWRNQTSGTDEKLMSVAFATPQLGWVVSDTGTILNTQDGGLSWHRQLNGRPLSLETANLAVTGVRRR